METLTLPADDSRQVIRCLPPIVRVDGRRRRDLAVATWEWLPAPEFGMAKLTLGDHLAGTASRFEHVRSLPPIGSNVLIQPGDNDDVDRFEGIVTQHFLQASAASEGLAAVVRHRLADILQSSITTLFQRSGKAVVESPQTSIVFNRGTTGLCSSQAVSFANRTARAFDASASARPWTVADALGYLLATAVPQCVEIPNLDELDSLAGTIDLGVLDATGMSAADALMQVAARGGLAVRAARQGLGLVIYRPGVTGRVCSVRLQPAGGRLDTAQSNLHAASVTINRRPARKSVLALGAPKQYESTFELRPGWEAALQSQRWRQFVRSMSSNWPLLADVYRKWVLNEHDWYSQQPWDLTGHTFAEICADEFPLRLPRRLLPCLSTNTSNQSLGVVLEVRYSPGAPWLHWRGPLWVSRDECAVYLGGDALPAEFFRAAVNGTAQVRVTATVEADRRLTAFLPGDSGCGTVVLDQSARAAWRKVHPTSAFYGHADLGTPAQRDDWTLLDQLARRHREAFSPAVEATLDLAWIDTSYHVGDIVSRIEGRNIDLAAQCETRPAIVAVRHDFGPAQSTQLVLRG